MTSRCRTSSKRMASSTTSTAAAMSPAPGAREKYMYFSLAPGAGDIAAAVEVVELAMRFDDVLQRLVMTATAKDLAVLLLGLDHEHIVSRHTSAVGQHV